MQNVLESISDFFADFINEVKQKNPLYIAITAAAVLLLVALVTMIILKTVNGGKATSNTAPVANDVPTSAAEDANYNKEENKIEKTEFDGTILIETPDAGEEYIDETLFVGDSNTARMFMFGPVTLQNSLGASSMGIQHVTSDACMYFSGYSSPITVVQAVKLMQPRRIYINYGTNNTAWDTDTFIKYYKNAISQIHDAYPAADIVIVGVLPVARIRTYTSITMQSIDSFNAGLVKLAKEDGYYYLDSNEAIADNSGYAVADYMETDGIHLNSKGMAAYMKYVRTHALDTEDTRPALTSIPTHSMATPDSHFGPAVVVSSSEESSSSSHVHTYNVTVEKEATETEEGILRYTCTVAGCNETYTEPIPKIVASSHVHAYAVTGETPATCTVPGVRTYTCTCGSTYTEEIPLIPHTFVVTAEVPAQVGVDGSRTYTCSVCGATYTEAIPMLSTPAPDPVPPAEPAATAETPAA